jgi:hypothetical protein
LLLYGGQSQVWAAPDVRSTVKAAVGQMQVPEKRAEGLQILVELGPAAVDTLVDIHQRDEKAREVVFDALVHIATDYAAKSSKAVPILAEGLSRPEQSVRLRAAQTLSSMGFSARMAIPALTKALNTSEGSQAAAALASIAESLQDNRKRLSSDELAESVKALEKSVAAARAAFPADSVSQSNVGRIRRPTEFLSLWQEASALNASVIRTFIRAHPGWGVVLFLVLAWPTALVLLLVVRPLWLLKLNDFVTLLPHVIPRDWRPEVPILGKILFTHFFAYRPRVLDAWVNRHLSAVRDGIGKLARRDEQEVHVPVPVMLDDRLVEKLQSADFQSLFRHNRIRILIHGEGGVGKTNLAYELARRAMDPDAPRRLCPKNPLFPVVLSEESYAQGGGDAKPGERLLEAVRGRLASLASRARQVNRELLEELLLQRRVLVIVDDASELNEVRQGELQPDNPLFPVNALVVTSRSERALDSVQKTLVEPLRLKESALQLFVESYVQQRGKTHLFQPGELANYCSNLRRIAATQDITVLLAKLYADLVLSLRQHKVDESLPSNIPDLMLGYLNYLNRVSRPPLPTNEKVYEAAKLLAWECLRERFLPSVIERKTARSLLGNDDHAIHLLEHLEERLRLVKQQGVRSDTLRFSLDPLAEYLAALWLVDNHRNRRHEWDRFLQEARSKREASKEVEGFLAAVLDCCETKRYERDIPEFVITKLCALLGREPPAPGTPA